MLLIDSDILIDFIRGYKPAYAFFENNKGIIFISILSKFEIIAGARDQNKIIKSRFYIPRLSRAGLFYIHYSFFCSGLSGLRITNDDLSHPVLEIVSSTVF